MRILLAAAVKIGISNIIESQGSTIFTWFMYFLTIPILLFNPLKLNHQYIGDGTKASVL